MRVVRTQIDGVWVVELDRFRDERGFFLESYHETKFRKMGIEDRFVQDNHSRSVRGTLRGLHGQLRRPQAKLIRVVQGEIFDVAVDVRPQSPSFGRWVGEVLTGENDRCLYIPRGFLHGFCVMSPTAEVEYKCSDLYVPGDEIGVRWNDPDLAITWPVPDPILSAKDRALPELKVVRGLFEAYRGK